MTFIFMGLFLYYQDFFKLRSYEKNTIFQCTCVDHISTFIIHFFKSLPYKGNEYITIYITYLQHINISYKAQRFWPSKN